MSVQPAVSAASLSSAVFKAVGVNEAQGLSMHELPSKHYFTIDRLETKNRSVSHAELSRAFGHADAEARVKASSEIDSLVERRESAQKWSKIFNWGSGLSLAGFLGATALGVNPWIASNALLWSLFSFIGGSSKRREAERVTGQIGDAVDAALVDLPKA